MGFDEASNSDNFSLVSARLDPLGYEGDFAMPALRKAASKTSSLPAGDPV
jgi:hypothetical protein